MASSSSEFNTAFEDDKDLLLTRVGQLVFVDGAAGFECGRCDRALIRHYVASCGHKFCANCRKVLTVSKSNCPLPDCRKSIENIDQQDIEFERKLFDFTAHCPNQSYGCLFTSKLKDLGTHLKTCKDTRDNALPVLIPDNNFVETVLRELGSKFNRLSEDVQQIQKENTKNFKDLETKIDKSLRDKLKELKDENDKKTAALEKSLAETVEKREEVTSMVNALSAKVESLSKDLRAELLNQSKYRSDFQKCFTKINNTNVRVELLNTTVKEGKAEMENAKTEIDKKIVQVIDTLNEKANIKAENENHKGNLIELNRKIEIIEDQNSGIVEYIKQEMDSIPANIEGIVELLISPLSIDFGEKMSEFKTEITKFEEKIKQQNKYQIQFNKSTELFSLEKLGFNLERYLELTFDQMNCFTLAQNKGYFQPDFTWKITLIKDKVKQKSYEITSEAFEWTGYPVQAQAKLKFKTTISKPAISKPSIKKLVASLSKNVIISLCLKERDIGKLMKFIPQVYYVLRDRSGTKSPKHICRTTSNFFTAKFDYSLDFDATISNKFKLIHPAYNVDDSIVIDVYVEPPRMSRTAYSYDGTLVGAIDDYRNRKRMEKESLVEYQESPYFYTAAKGYRVQVRMELANGSAVSVHFLSGEFDADLSENFPHQTTVTLFSHKTFLRNVVKTVNQDILTDKSYVINMCGDSEIENYLLNDTLFYKVTIKPSN